MVDHKPKAAAIRAGYSPKTADVKAQQLLKNPIIKAALGKLERLDVEKLELDRHEVLRQLYYCVTREARDFVDENGKLVTDVNKLPQRAQCAVDGIEQEIHYDSEGNEYIKTKYKLVSKAAVLDMAMKHKGLFAPDQQEVRHVLDWDALCKPAAMPANVIETKALEVADASRSEG